MKNIFRSLIVLGLVGAFVVAVTQSFFSDKEESKNNTLVAGAIDLKIDNDSYYNGNRCTEVDTENGKAWQWVGSAVYPVPGTPCTTSWALSDLPGKLFFNFTDLKPNDHGEDTISMHVENDAWVCMDLTLTSDDDKSSTEPELATGDPAEDPQNDWDGELGGLIQMIWWADDGDNVLEVGEHYLVNNETPLSIKSLFGSDNKYSVTIADSASNVWGLPTGTPMKASETHYIAKGWCFGTMTVNPIQTPGNYIPNGPQGPGFTCDGKSLGNESQTDAVTMDVQFSAVQARHNHNFKCKEDEGGLPCEDLDVMLVIDRSSSIDAGELAQLKTAANGLVTALNPTETGTHVGVVSFGTLASLDIALSGNLASITTAVSAISVAPNSYTNLQQGIFVASQQLASNGRPDKDDIIIILTDGAPTAYGNPAITGEITDPPTPASNQAITEATNAKATATIYTVGIGLNATTTAYLANSIATAPANAYSVANFGDLSNLFLSLVCQNENGGGNGTPTPTPVSLFFDSFDVGGTNTDVTFNENPDIGTISPGGWTQNGTGTQKRAPGTGNDSLSLNGGRFAAIVQSGGWICRSFNATGYNTLSLSYEWRGDSEAEGPGGIGGQDFAYAEYKIGGSCSDAAATWTNLETHAVADDEAWSSHIEALPASLNGATFLLRFRNMSASAGGQMEDFRLDGVSLTGIPN